MKQKFLSYVAAVSFLAGVSLVGITNQAKAESAAVSPGVTLSVGYAGENFHYGETIGDQEHGWLNGFYVGVNYKSQNNVLGLGNFELGLKNTYLTNSVTYDGAQYNLATGVTTPYTGTTNEGINNIELQGGFSQALASNISVGEYLSLGYRYWNRNMKGIGGYTEDYNTGYIGLGVKGNVNVMDNLNVGLNVSGRWSPSWSSINYMTNDYGTFNMGNSYNFKLEVPIAYNITNNLSINLTPYYSYWHFGQSNTINTIIYGYQVTAYEPSSETNSLGLNTGISYRF